MNFADEKHFNFSHLLMIPPCRLWLSILKLNFFEVIMV